MRQGMTGNGTQVLLSTYPPPLSIAANIVRIAVEGGILEMHEREHSIIGPSKISLPASRSSQAKAGCLMFRYLIAKPSIELKTSPNSDHHFFLNTPRIVRTVVVDRGGIRREDLHDADARGLQ